MLAYRIRRELQAAWAHLNVTVEEGLQQLSTLCSTEVVVKGLARFHQIPTPTPTSAELLKAEDIHLPKVLPLIGAQVVTRRTLQSRRRTD